MNEREKYEHWTEKVPLENEWVVDKIEKDYPNLISPYPKNFKPDVKVIKCPSGAVINRYASLYDGFYWDYPRNRLENKVFSANVNFCVTNYSDVELEDDRDKWYNKNVKPFYKKISKYINLRSKMIDSKMRMIEEIKANLNADKEYMELIHLGKSNKRKYSRNKFVGVLNVPRYSMQSDYIFQRIDPKMRRPSLNMAFQVGRLSEGYANEIMKIIKMVMMCHSLGIHVNVDFFDSDVRGSNFDYSYSIINIANSNKRLNWLDLMSAYHQEFFTYTLFLNYIGKDSNCSIDGFIGEKRIIHDLGKYYDIIGGNMISEEVSNDPMISKIIKISKVLV